MEKEMEKCGLNEIAPSRDAGVTLDELKNTHSDIVIYGAASVGEAVLAACNARGLNVRAFCDDTRKTGDVFCGKEIISFKDLTDSDRPVFFIIAVSKLDRIVEKINKTTRFSWSPAYLVLEGFDLSKYHFSTQSEIKTGLTGIEITQRCLANQDNYFMGRIALLSLDITITEKCSLRCRDCGALMPYYQHPRNYSLETIFRDIVRVLKVVDRIEQLNILGGEPFMLKNFHHLLGKLTEFTQIGRVVVVSNGTIMPTREQLPFFQMEKVMFRFSDYGSLSRNLSRIEAEFDSHGIRYARFKPERWHATFLKKHHRDSSEAEALFENCANFDCKNLLDGKLYFCAFMAHATNLGIINEPEDRIDLDELDNMALSAAKNRFKAFLNRSVMASCDYCPGYPLVGGNEVTPAVQTEKVPLPYCKLS